MTGEALWGLTPSLIILLENVWQNSERREENGIIKKEYGTCTYYLKSAMILFKISPKISTCPPLLSFVYLL